MSLTATHFTSSDGRKIRLIPGWFEKLDSWGSASGGAKSFKEHVEDVGNDTNYPTGFGFFMNKLWTAQSMLELFRQHAVSLPIDGPILDLCTGPAILPRVFKALGVCTGAYGIDIYSRHDDYSDELMIMYWNVAATIAQSGKGNEFFNENFIHFNDFQTGLNNAGGIIHQKFDASRIGMDEYIEGDVYKDCPDRKFPLITLNAGMEHFDVSDFLSIVSDSLSPGGTFLTFNYYFYDVWAGMFLPMDAPWLHARLTDDDFMRYYETVRPEIYDSVKTKCEILRTPPLFTVHDYRKEAEKFGLELFGYRRSFNQSILSGALFSDEDFRNYMYSEALSDCQRMNPNVKMDDLFTKVLVAVYRKKEN